MAGRIYIRDIFNKNNEMRISHRDNCSRIKIASGFYFEGCFTYNRTAHVDRYFGNFFAGTGKLSGGQL